MCSEDPTFEDVSNNPTEGKVSERKRVLYISKCVEGKVEKYRRDGVWRRETERERE